MPEIITSLSDLSRLRQGAASVANQLKHSGPVMMMLGPFMFAMDTAAYTRWQRSNEYRWSAQERVGRLPAMQYLGPGSEKVDLEGVIVPEFSGGTGQMQAIRELAGLGKPLFLVDGLGIFYGNWIISSVEETSTVLRSDGSAKRIEFRLSMQSYGDDQPGLLAKYSGIR